MYSSSPSPPSHDCSPRPVRPGGRACAHAWPAPRTLSPFLSAEAAAAPRARLGPSGDLPPSERGGPERLRSLLSAAGGRVATFVNCKQTHVVLQQSRPCLVLVASPPRFLLPPPAAASFLSLLHRSLWAPPLQGRLGGPCRAWGQGARGYNAAMPRLRARGGGCGEPGGCECLLGPGLQRGRGACWRGGEGVARKKQRVPKSGSVWHRSAEEATLDQMPKFNAHACGTGPPGDAKYNRAKLKAAWRKELYRQGTRDRGSLLIVANETSEAAKNGSCSRLCSPGWRQAARLLAHCAVAYRGHSKTRAAAGKRPVKL